MTRVLIALLTLAALALPARAAEPTLEVRVRSLGDFLDRFEYLGGLANQGEAGKQFAGLIRSMADADKGLEGFDLARPVGLYATLTEDVVDSPVVLMLPVLDEAAARGAIVDKLKFGLKKGENGVAELTIPDSPAPVFLRFAHKTAYFTAQSAKGVDEATLIKPEAFFPADSKAVDLPLLRSVLRLDRVPASVKKAVVAQAELKANDALREAVTSKPGQKKLGEFLAAQSSAALKAVFAEGRALTLTADAAPKGDELNVTLGFTAVDGSSLGKQVAAFKALESFALPAVKNPLVAVQTRLAIPEASREAWAEAVQESFEAIVAQAQGNDKVGAQVVLGMIAPTVKAGELHLGLTVAAAGEPNAPAIGHGLTALKVTGGREVVGTLKTLAAFAPKDQATIEFDVKKASGFVLHKLTVSKLTASKEVFSNIVWLATSDTLFVASQEDEPKRLLEALPALAKPAATPPVAVEVSLARLFRVFEKAVPADRLRELSEEAFGTAPAAGRDQLRLTVTGGESLAVNLRLTGSAVRYLVMVDQEKKK